MGNQKKTLALLFMFILLAQGTLGRKCDCTKAHVGATAGGMGALALVGFGVLALGFGPAGIAAGSVAAKMMAASTAYGYGGAAVATLQSVGAAGMAVSGKVAVAGAGAAAGYSAAGCDCEC